MTVDLSKLKIGDTIVRRDEGLRVITNIELCDNDDEEYYCALDWIVDKKPETLCKTLFYTKNGHYNTQEFADNWDIVEIIPKLEKQEKVGTYAQIINKVEEKYNPATAKTDTGKDRLDLLPYAGLASAAKAFEYGMGQYGHNNYQNAKSYRPFLAAAIRHIMKKLDGEDFDKDSGLDHISHSLACLLMAEKLKAQGKPMNNPDTMKPYGVRNQPKE